MKLNENQCMYLRSMGKAVKITGIFTDEEATNKFCEHTNNGVIAQFGKYIFTADLGDNGVSISALSAENLLSLIDGAKDVVELFEAKSPAQIVWKNNWLTKGKIIFKILI